MKLPQNYNALTWEQRKTVREEYARIQKGLCHHCKEPIAGNPSVKVMQTPVTGLLFPDGFFGHPTHLHHSHETGETIGAVHARCNAVLWEHHGE